MSSTQTDRIDGLSTSVAVKAPVRVATNTNSTLSGLATIDSVTISEGDRVLAKNQTNAKENGIYCASNGAWTRTKDFDGNRDVVKGTLVPVQNGVIYEATSTDPITIGSSDLFFGVWGRSATAIVHTTVTAIAAQTVVTAPTYNIGTNQLEVYVNGLRKIAGVDFTETSTTSVTFNSGLAASDTVDFYVGDVARDTSSGADYGMVAGGADNSTAFASALANHGGKEMRLPKGTYHVDMTKTNTLAPLANTTIRGEGDESVLRFNFTESGTITVFNNSAGKLRFENCKIEIGTATVGSTIVLFSLAASLELVNCEIDGSVTGASGASHLTQVIKSHATTNWNKLTISHCHIHHITRVWLRANSDTSIIRNISVSLSHFEASESSMFAFNAPNGEIIDVRFLGNTFKDPYIGVIQGDSYCIGPQVSNFSSVGDVFLGSGNECIHIEEAAQNISIASPTIDMDCTAAAIRIIDNNIGGASVQPTRVTITGGTIKRTDSDNTTGDGIECVNNGGTGPVAQLIVNGVNISGWGVGIRSGGDLTDGISIKNCTIEDCGVGFKPKEGAPGFKDNLIKDCAIGIQSIAGGGTIGFTRFDNCTIPVDGTGGELVLGDGFEMIFPQTNLTASGNTDFTLLPAGASDRCYGTIYGHVFFSDSNEEKHLSEINWDGSSLNAADKITIGGGQLAVSFLEDSGLLKMRVANSSAELANAAIYTHFAGTYVVS